MEQIDLKQLIKQYPEVLTDGTKLKAYILDLYPQCKRGMVNILVAIQQCGIVSEMQANKNPSALDMSRWKKVLDDDYGFVGTTAETCLQMWCIAVGIQLEASATQKTSVSSDLQNSQRDWFEYDGAILLKLKGKYADYKGEIYIPNSVDSIGNDAFFGRTGLTSITIPHSVTSIGDRAFDGCKGLTSITISNGVKSIGRGAFFECSSLTNVMIPDSVTNIGEAAFSGCTALTSITIPNSVTSIGDSVFSRCTGLTSIKIPNSVTSIDEEAFRGCTGLTSITIPDGVTSIGEAAFSRCTGLASITISDGVTSIGDYAFVGCKELIKVIIPASVENIGGSAFKNCSGLTSIKVDSGNTTYHSQDNCVVETANIFTNLLYCADCGSRMWFHKSTNKVPVRHFFCSNYKGMRGTCNDHHYIREDALTEVVLSELRRLATFLACDEDAFAELLRQKTDADMMAEQKRLEAGLAAAQARNAEVLKLYERIYEDNVNGKVSDEWFMQLSKKYEEEKAELKKRIFDYTERLNRLSGMQTAKDGFLRAIRSFL